MAEKHIANSRYVYIHDASKWPSQTVDVHQIVVRRKGLLGDIRTTCFSVFLLLLNAFYLLVGQGKVSFVLVFYLVTGALFIKSLRGRLVNKESIVIIPAFGVQLETHYQSGRAVRRFIPIDKILKPLLNECVTPVTCYWSLALILRDEEELMLVFKKLRPPLKMLAPIWRAICAATDSRDSLDMFPDGS